MFFSQNENSIRKHGVRWRKKTREKEGGVERRRGERWSSANPCSLSVTWLITINFPGIDGLPGPELHSLLLFAWYVLCVPWHDSHSTTPSPTPGSPTCSTPIVALKNINSWLTVCWRRDINQCSKNTTLMQYFLTDCLLSVLGVESLGCVIAAVQEEGRFLFLSGLLKDWALVEKLWDTR